MLLRQRLKSRLDFTLVVCARIGRRIHPCKQHCHAARLSAFDNAAQIIFHLADRLPAQKIVCPKLQNQKTDITFQSPVYASKTSRGCLA